MASDSATNEYSLFAASGDQETEKNNENKKHLTSVPSPHPKFTWDELEAIEVHRREILQRVELPFYRILTFSSGTCLRALTLDWMVWVPIFVFLLIRYQARNRDNMPGVVEQLLADTDVDIIGGFLSFFLVLFVNQTNARFFEMYQLSKRCAGRVQDVAGYASVRLPPAAAQRLTRYMNAAHTAGYVGLGGPYQKHNFFDHFDRKHGLLTKDELARVEMLDMDGGSSAFKELCTWCQREVGRAQQAGHVDSIEANELQSRILDLRAAMDGIYDYRDQPTHFFYIHFLCLLSALYLPLFAVDNAYSAGWGQDADWSIEVVNGTIVLLQAIFVVGLRLLGQIMIDPYGDDWEDLSVITYVSTTIANCQIFLATPQQPDDANEATERQLFQSGSRDEQSDKDKLGGAVFA